MTREEAKAIVDSFFGPGPRPKKEPAPVVERPVDRFEKPKPNQKRPAIKPRTS
jgi:hypothetical protein